MEKVEPTELDKELLEKGVKDRKAYRDKMVEYRALWLEDTTNDYTLFLYLASIMDYIEYHNKGCLTELGMLSLKIDISPYIHSIQTGEPKLTQKNLVRLCLNIVNSYAVSVLCNGMIEFGKTDSNFYTINDFPSAMLVDKDFDTISSKLEYIIPKLKQFLDNYAKLIEGKYIKVFNEEKNKGFVKPIFDVDTIRIRSKLPSNLSDAIECK